MFLCKILFLMNRQFSVKDAFKSLTKNLLFIIFFPFSYVNLAVIHLLGLSAINLFCIYGAFCLSLWWIVENPKLSCIWLLFWFAYCFLQGYIRITAISWFPVMEDLTKCEQQWVDSWFFLYINSEFFCYFFFTLYFCFADLWHGCYCQILKCHAYCPRTR